MSESNNPFYEVFKRLWVSHGRFIVTDETGVAWGKFAWAKAGRAYINKIEREHGHLRLIGKTQDQPLEGIFTDVYLLDTPQAYARYDLEKWREEQTDWRQVKPKGERIPGLDLLAKHPRLFILGQPGAGKTTFLKYVAWQASQGRIKQLPLFVSLKELVDSGLPLLDFMVRQLMVCAFPDTPRFLENLLHSSLGLVLLDGLDEVNQTNQQRDEMTAKISDFARTFHECPMLMTCRVAATDSNFQGFTYVEMANFSEEQIATFASKWFAHDATKEKQFVAELNQPDHEGLRELAQTPLLLTLLCLVFEGNVAFPKRQVEVYEEAFNILLREWDEMHIIRRKEGDELYRRLSLGQKQQLFSTLAMHNFEQGQFFIPKRLLCKQIVDYLKEIPPGLDPLTIDGEGVLRAIEAQHGILVERAQGIYSFAHLTFQEYFTAKYVVEHMGQEKEALGRLMRFATNEKWREVFLLVASLLDEAQLFFKRFLQALQQTVKQDDALLQLLQMADTKAQWRQSQLEHQVNPAAIRITFTYFILDIARTHTLALALVPVLSFDSDFVRNFGRNVLFYLRHTFDHTLDSAHTGALLYAFVFALDLALDFDLDDFALDLARGRDCGSDLTLTSIGNLASIHYLQSIDDLPSILDLALDRVRVLTKSCAFWGVAELAKTLALLEKPTNVEELRLFWNALAKEIQAHHPMGQEWALNEKQVKLLGAYLWGNQLLLDCLALAYVPDREGIKAQMFLVDSGQLKVDSEEV